MNKVRLIAIFAVGGIISYLWKFRSSAIPINVTHASFPQRVLIPLPSYGFDPTEAAVPWYYMNLAGHQITFSTPDGKRGYADERMVTGKDLSFLKSSLLSTEEAIKIYHELEKDINFLSPIPYDAIKPINYDAIFLPGGHDKGMREYLDSKIVQSTIVSFFEDNKNSCCYLSWYFSCCKKYFSQNWEIRSMESRNYWINSLARNNCLLFN